MGTARLNHLIVASLVAIAIVPVLIAGCGGDDTNPAVNTGTVTGRTIDATSGLGLGGVTVQIGNVIGGQFVAAASAESTTPNGDYSLSRVPTGTYRALRVIPVSAIAPERTVTVNVIVTNGQTVSLGPVLVIDDVPPDPGL